MFTHENLKIKLKSELFDIVDIAQTTSYEEIALLISDLLSDCLNVSTVKLGIYRAWFDNNKLTIYSKEDENILPQMLTESHYVNHLKAQLRKEHIVSVHDEDDQQYYFIDIKSTYEPSGFVLMSNEKNYDVDFLNIVSEQLIKAFNIINRNLYSEYDQKRSSILLDLSSELYSLYNTKGIFKVVIEKLEDLYPHFSHYLLLSQDYDQDSSLPIKTIEYGGNAELTAGTRAFINGELEIEHDINQKKSHIYIPLVGNQGVYGVIQTTLPLMKNIVDNDVIDFLKKIAQITGLSIERTSLYQSSNRLVSDLQVINEASHKLNSNLEKGEIINTVKQQIKDSCFATEVGFLKFNDDGNYCHINKQSTKFFLNDDNKAYFKIIFDEIEKRETSMFYGNFKSVHEKFPYQSIMFIPMRMSDYEYGVTVIMNEAEYYFSFEKFKFIESLVQHATLALMNTSLKEELEKAVITDYLTKVYSRNYLDEMVASSMEQDDRGVFLLFDIDNFKSINDKYGHNIGDKVLIQIANVLNKKAPLNGFPARWGGEEFAVYVPAVKLQDGINLANDIRKEVIKASAPNVTLSSGVAFWTKDKADSVKNIFIRADQALYQAKTTGKNKVVSELQINNTEE